jgi:hypothetical protein
VPDLSHGLPGAILEELLIRASADFPLGIDDETVCHRLGRESRSLAFDHTVHSQLLHAGSQRCVSTAIAAEKALIRAVPAIEIVTFHRGAPLE